MAINSSVENAASLLELLNNERRPLTVTEISRELGITRSTAYSLLDTLAAHLLVYRRPDNRYYLAAGCFELGLGYRSQFNHLIVCNAPLVEFLTQTARPWLKVCDLMAMQADLTIFAAIENFDRARFQMEINRGQHYRRIQPWYATAGGKMLVAHLPERTQAECFALIPEFLPEREAFAARVKAQLLTAAHDKYLADTEDFYGVSDVSAAAPVYNAHGEVVAAVDFIVSHDYYRADATTLRDSLLLLGRQLSNALGYSPIHPSGTTPNGRRRYR